jgi:hypothetical protein
MSSAQWATAPTMLGALELAAHAAAAGSADATNAEDVFEAWEGVHELLMLLDTGVNHAYRHASTIAASRARRAAKQARLEVDFPSPPPRTDTDAPGWEALAALTYVSAPNGTWRPHWDKRTAILMQGTPRPLWPLFHALPAIPLLLVHGRLSRLLTDDGVASMQAARPDMPVVEVANVGHAPTLAEPEVLTAIDAFVDRL